MKSEGIKESTIEKQILMYLKYKGVLAFKVKSMGTYDQKLGRFRMPSPLYRRGVSDIIGIYKGRPLALEVKSAIGKASDEQKLFLQDWKREGGVAAIVRSVEHVELLLKLLDQESA